jgi:hypothetical protein
MALRCVNTDHIGFSSTYTEPHCMSHLSDESPPFDAQANNSPSKVESL